jgi:hypothetical protein
LLAHNPTLPTEHLYTVDLRPDLKLRSHDRVGVSTKEIQEAELVDDEQADAGGHERQQEKDVPIFRLAQGDAEDDAEDSEVSKY